MNSSRFSQDEFDTLFPGPFESDQEKLREYHAFLRVLGQLDEAPIPELSAREKADIFRRAWPQPTSDRPLLWAWLTLFRRPAVTFALGIAFGCAIMFACLKPRPVQVQPAPPEPLYTVVQTGDTQTYQGKILKALYPQIENPRLVVEKSAESSESQRVVYGTLDNGEIYVAWNL
jgi:hypothetical protein